MYTCAVFYGGLSILTGFLYSRRLLHPLTHHMSKMPPRFPHLLSLCPCTSVLYPMLLRARVIRADGWKLPFWSVLGWFDPTMYWLSGGLQATTSPPQLRQLLW